MPCSYNFSLTNYTINIDGAIHRVLHPSDITGEMPLSITNLTQDASFSLTVTACNHVTCRTSESRIFCKLLSVHINKWNVRLYCGASLHHYELECGWQNNVLNMHNSGVRRCFVIGGLKAWCTVVAQQVGWAHQDVGGSGGMLTQEHFRFSCLSR